MNSKIIFLVGVIGVILFVSSSVIGGLLIENYSITRQYISETFAIDTEYGIVLRVFGHIPSGILFTIFSILGYKYFPSSNLTKIDFKVSASAATYSPGQTLTATATDIGFGGTGAVIVTIDSTVLTTDTLSMAGTAVDLNGAIVINSGDGEITDLTYTSTSTNGSIPD